MSMPLKLTKFEIPSFILSHYVIPYAEQCYLISIEYQYINLNKLLIILLKDCASINGTIHLKLNDIVDKLMLRYNIEDSKPEWIIQEMLFLIHRELQSYFYHRVELTLSQHNR